jgi:hypothetical protein
MPSIKRPSPATLDRYGFGCGPAALADTPYDDWFALLASQTGTCGACRHVPPALRLNVDHEHVRGWKDMPPEKRRIYVRGLLCYMCNHYRLARGATVDNLRGAADYLERYEERRAEAGV